MDWVKTTARRDQKYLSFEIWCDLYKGFTVILIVSAWYDECESENQKYLLPSLMNWGWNQRATILLKIFSEVIIGYGMEFVQ